MAASSSRKSWTSGRMNTEWNSTSVGLASQLTMRRSRALTVDSVRSARTLTGSCPLPMQKPRSRSGGSTIMRRVPTLHCSGPHHQNSPVRQGKRPNRAFQRSRKFLLQTGTNSGVRSEAGNFYFRPVLILGYGHDRIELDVYGTNVGAMTESGRGREHTTAYRARRREITRRRSSSDNAHHAARSARGAPRHWFTRNSRRDNATVRTMQY